MTGVKESLAPNIHRCPVVDFEGLWRLEELLF